MRYSSALALLLFANLCWGEQFSNNPRKRSESIGYINPKFAELLEAIHGDHILSKGGEKSVLKMFEGEDLSGKKVIEIGSGSGGPLFVLGGHYRASFTGVEFDLDSYNRTLKNQEKYRGIPGNLNFIYMESPEELSKIPSNTYDYVYIKEYYFLIPHDYKLLVLKHIFRILKPGGKFILTDYVKKGEFNRITTEMLDSDYMPYSLMDIVWILTHLSREGFLICEEKEITKEYVGYLTKSLETLAQIEGFISEKFGGDIYKITKVSYLAQIEAFEKNEMGIMFIKAEKPRANNSNLD